MSSRLLQWESDPLFSAAEVVQDSADRMESIFRLLLHELSLLQQDHPDPRLLKSVEYHRRDLATLLEATRWQLEDFEKAINISATQNENRKEDITLRHKQFVSAIKQHISNIENSLDNQSFKDTLRNYGTVSLSDQDRNGLALFLSGGNITEQIKQYEMDDSTMLRRFLDPVSSAGLQDNNAETVECRSKGIDSFDMNGTLNEDCSFGVQDSIQEETVFNGHDKVWDVEANEATNKAIFQKRQQRGKVSQLFSNLCGTFGCRITTNYTKKLKDGEEQMNSAACGDVSHTSQCRFSARSLFSTAMHLYIQLAALKDRYERMPYYQANKRVIHLLLAAFSVLTVTVFCLARSH